MPPGAGHCRSFAARVSVERLRGLRHVVSASRVPRDARAAAPWPHVQPVLTPTELALVDQVAEITQSKRTDVIKNALAVYHWFVRQSLTGGRVIARRPSGEEVTLETAELSALEGKANRLSAEELGLLAERLASAADPAEAALLRERLTRGFYGI